MSDIFVLCSDNEGLSNAMMEAMATRLACVVTDTPGAAEVIEHGVTGYVTERSARGVLDGLRSVLALSPERRAQLTSDAREVIRARFDLRVGVAKEMRLLEILE
jgi:glycosyltransferase involved in cell wall biosynthesis